MKYNFNDTLLTDEEKYQVTKIANDKLVDLLSTFVKKADGVFFGKMRLKSYIDMISSIKDEVAKIDKIIDSIDSLNEEELLSIAKEQEINVLSNVDKPILLHDIKEGLISKRMKLNDQVSALYNASDRNYENTFEHTFQYNIEVFSKEREDELNVNAKASFDAIINSFNSICTTLNGVHKLFDALINDVTLLDDYNEELSSSNFDELIKKYEDTYNLSTEYRELKSIREKLAQAREEKASLVDLIDKQKKAILNEFNNAYINFNDLKINIYENFDIIYANMDSVMQDPYLNINKEDVAKYKTAFNEFLYDILVKEDDFKNYLEDKNVKLDSLDKNNIRGNTYSNDTLTKEQSNEPVMTDSQNIDEENQMVNNGLEADYSDTVNEQKSEDVIDDVQVAKTPTEEVKEETQVENVIADTNTEGETEITPETISNSEVVPDYTLVNTQFRVSTFGETASELLSKAKDKAKRAIAAGKIFMKNLTTSSYEQKNAELLNDLRASDGRTM